MKDHVEIGHLTKYDAFRVNRDQVMDLEIWFKICVPPKSIILGQMTNLNMIFHVVLVYRLVKI